MSDAAKSAILRRIHDLEREHEITVLYACESGSRCWGFESRDSDWDVRFIFKYRRDQYLTLEDPLQQIEWMGDSEWGKLDIVGWDLKKTLGLVAKSNPAMLEWVQSPVTYVEREPLRGELTKLTQRSFYPVASAHHYANLARTVVPKALDREEVVFKRYFYLIRPLLALRWIADGRGVPPVEFSTLVSAYIPASSDVRNEIDALLVRKRAADELSSGPRIPVLHEYLVRAVDELEELIERARRLGDADTRPTADELNRFFREAVNA